MAAVDDATSSVSKPRKKAVEEVLLTSVRSLTLEKRSEDTACSGWSVHLGKFRPQPEGLYSLPLTESRFGSVWRPFGLRLRGRYDDTPRQQVDLEIIAKMLSQSIPIKRTDCAMYIIGGALKQNLPKTLAPSKALNFEFSRAMLSQIITHAPAPSPRPLSPWTRPRPSPSSSLAPSDTGRRRRCLRTHRRSSSRLPRLGWQSRSPGNQLPALVCACKENSAEAGPSSSVRSAIQGAYSIEESPPGGEVKSACFTARW